MKLGATHAVVWFLGSSLVAGCTGGSSPDGSQTPDQTAADVDSDGDGLSDAEEAELGLDASSSDTDGDGLQDGAEIDAGTDPLSADTDADYLSDGDEIDAGTDPLVDDTDGDGYLDGDEIAEGKDPLDETSVIYQGGWPYNHDKDAMGNPGFSGSVSIGGLFPDVVGFDQFGDEVHLYDFAFEGRPVVIDFSAMWCNPCHQLATYLGGTDNGFGLPNLQRAVEDGEVRWVTVILQNLNYGPSSQSDAEGWSDQHPDPNIPVLAPRNAQAPMSYIDLIYFPSVVWLDENLEVVSYDQDPYVALGDLESHFAR